MQCQFGTPSVGIANVWQTFVCLIDDKNGAFPLQSANFQPACIRVGPLDGPQRGNIACLKAIFLAVGWDIKLALKAPEGIPDFDYTAQLVHGVGRGAVFEG